MQTLVFPYPRKNFIVVQSRTLENSPLLNKMEIILIIEHNAEKKIIPTLFLLAFEDMVHQFIMC